MLSRRHPAALPSQATPCRRARCRTRHQYLGSKVHPHTPIQPALGPCLLQILHQVVGTDEVGSISAGYWPPPPRRAWRAPSPLPLVYRRLEAEIELLHGAPEGQVRQSRPGNQVALPASGWLHSQQVWSISGYGSVVQYLHRLCHPQCLKEVAARLPHTLSAHKKAPSQQWKGASHFRSLIVL